VRCALRLGLYRYFAGYEDLIGALCVDAYESLADALTAANNSQPDTDPTGECGAAQMRPDLPGGSAAVGRASLPGSTLSPRARPRSVLNQASAAAERT
jgi:hypothetical protein